jgi:hypothetical protein
MPEDLPEFDSDAELIEWFETADLSQYPLDEVLAWSIAEHVSLTIEEPWATEHPSAGSRGATATIELDQSLLTAGR